MDKPNPLANTLANPLANPPANPLAFPSFDEIEFHIQYGHKLRSQAVRGFFRDLFGGDKATKGRLAKIDYAHEGA